MPANAPHGEPLTEDELHEIRDTAYFLWEQEGRPEGRAPEFWRRAMEQFRRARAYQLWLEEGRPEDRADEHWRKAGEVD